MNQFDSELAANETRAKFDALSEPGIGSSLTGKLIKLILSPLRSDPSSGAATIAELASAFWEDREKRSAKESEFLLDAVVLMLKRHEGNNAEIQERLERLETRLEDGLKVALRFPHDGSRTTLERLAIVVVRGAMDFDSNPQEQTNEFLRIASQITESEVGMLRQIYEFQDGLSRQAGHSVNQGNWLSNVMNAWNNMTGKYPTTPDQWMQRKSALVRLESYGFIERTQGNPTANGSEVGQVACALLPLGQEFCEYIRPV